MATIDSIRAMLKSVQEEIATLRARIEILKQRENTLIDWVHEEAPAAVQSELPISEDESPLRAFLSHTLSASKKRLSAYELGSMAQERGLIKRDVIPGRAVHGALLSLLKNGQAKRFEDGTWSKE